MTKSIIFAASLILLATGAQAQYVGTGSNPNIHLAIVVATASTYSLKRQLIQIAPSETITAHLETSNRTTEHLVRARRTIDSF